MNNIYINIPQRQYRDLKLDIDAAVQGVLDSNRWLLGDATRTFTEAFKTYCSTSYCLPLANGTDALEIALRSAGAAVGEGCITVANAGGYTSTACHLVGLVPQYIDVNPVTLVMDLDLLADTIEANTKVIVATHLYGNVVDIVKIRQILTEINRTEIVIIEDCAQAHGALCHGKKVGSLGDMGTFSFYPTKNLGTLGDAGAIVMNKESLYLKAKHLHQYGWTSRYRNDIVNGRNSRMDEIHAAILNVKLPHLDAWNSRRRTIVEHYKNALPTDIKFVTDFSQNSVCHLAIIKLDNKQHRDTMLKVMKEHGIYCDIHYPILDYNQIAWQKDVLLPYSEAAVDCILTLPCFPELMDEELEKICTTFCSIYEKIKHEAQYMDI